MFTQKGYCEVMSIHGDKVPLRANPNQKEKGLWEYGNGFPLEIVKKQGNWVYVKDFENDSGWIQRALLRNSKQVIVKANRNESKPVNLHSGPHNNNQVVGTAYYGVVFSVLEKKGQWAHVHHDSGMNGWIKSNFLWGL